MSFTSYNPSNGQLLGHYQYSSLGEIQKVLNTLSEAQKNWKSKSLAERVHFLSGPLAIRMKENKSRLTDAISREMGKPLKDSQAEIAKCIRTLERLKEWDFSFLQSREIKTGTLLSKVQHCPLGVIYAIMPWNYPLWQVVRMFTPALVAGNTVLLKHSEIVPETSRIIHEIFQSHGEASILQQMYIEHSQTEWILSQPCVGGVSLTGSVRAGQTVAPLAAKYFKKSVFELGGSDPYIVLADADLKLAAKKITQSRLLNNGQTCISAKRAIVHKSVLAAFRELLCAEFESYKVGDPFAEGVNLGPLAHKSFEEKLKEQLREFTTITDAELVYEKPLAMQNKEGAFVAPKIYELKRNTDWLRDQEFFGPVLVLIPFETEKEAIELANSTDFGLAAGVFSENIERAQAVSQELIVGQVAINDFIFTDLNLPFGGFKKSGFGREMGIESFFEFTQTKVISVS